MRVADFDDRQADTARMAAPADAANENLRRRARAHGRALRHSEHVRLLRRVIPAASGLAALGIAGVVLYDPLAGTMPSVSVGPVSVSGTRVTMENPRLSGFRKGERGYEVTAAAAHQDVRKPALVELQAMKGHLAMDDRGGRTHLEARAGLFDSGQESLRLEEDIRLWTDRGEEVRLKSAAVDFKAGRVTSSDPVTVAVPSGTLSADSLDVVENGRVVSFVGNVRAVFHGHDAATARVAAAETDGSRHVRTSAAETAEAAR